MIALGGGTGDTRLGMVLPMARRVKSLTQDGKCLQTETAINVNNVGQKKRQSAFPLLLVFIVLGREHL
jgi:hypothetical protein